jgi:hypothetical protein
MHPKKAKLLEMLEETARLHEISLKRSVNIALHPEEHGWDKSLLTAAIVVPVTGFSAILNDVSRALLAQSDDAAWERGEGEPPKDAGAEGGRQP